MSQFTEQFIQVEKVNKSKTYSVRLLPYQAEKLEQDINTNGVKVNDVICKAVALYYYIKDEYTGDKDEIIQAIMRK